jgi:uncharacterized LabA/DUF88 family protein
LRSKGLRKKEGIVVEERLKLAVFIDFDNIQIGVKDTLTKDFDVSVVLEALKERGEVVSKIAYGDWSRSGDQSRQMTQHAVQLVQRNVTPRGDKNGADINLALDALEMAFTRDHINAFVIVGGDSDFITLVEKLKQYDKRVFVVGGRQFTSGILQRNCHEFISYENLLKSGGEGSRVARSARASGRAVGETRALSAALPNLHRALKILSEREVAPQLGLLKSTLLQLDPTFSERDYGTSSFLEFIQKLQQAGLAQMRKTERGYLVEAMDAESGKEPMAEISGPASEVPATSQVSAEETQESPREPSLSPEESLNLLKQAVAGQAEKAPSKPLYMRQIRQMMRTLDSRFDERQAGFRVLLDMLHQAQREGWVRLHRDRKGVWRIFPVLAPSAETLSQLTQAQEPVAEVATEPVPPATEVAPEAPLPFEEVGASSQAPVAEVPAPGGEERVAIEATSEHKTRKPRTARTSGRGGQRRTSSRRKAKEPAEQ